MALFMPSQITPDVRSGLGLGVVDATQPMVVSWRINGQNAMTAFSITILTNDSASTQLFTTGKITNGCPAYGTTSAGEIQMFSYTIPAASLSSAGISNGGEYKLVIRQWWSAVDSVTQSSASVFVTRAAPTLSINAIGSGGVIGDRFYTFTGVYSQGQGDVLNWFRWRIALAGDTDNPFFDTQNISGTMDISCSYDGFFTGQSYSIRLTCQTENGVEADTGWVNFSCSYSAVVSPGAITAQCVRASDAVAVRWSGFNYSEGQGSGSYSVSGGVLTLADGATVGWDNMNGSDMSIAAPWTAIISGTAQDIESDTAVVSISMTGGNVLTLKFYLYSGMLPAVGLFYNGVEIEGSGQFLWLDGDTFTFLLSASGAVWKCAPRGQSAQWTAAALSGVSFAAISSITCAGPAQIDYVQILQNAEARFGTLQSAVLGGTYTPSATDENGVFFADFADGTIDSGAAGFNPGTLTQYSVYRKRADEERLVHIAELPTSATGITDYGAGNSESAYTYYLFPRGNSNYQALVSNAVSPCFWSWVLMECQPTEDKDIFSVLAAYSFKLNVESDPMSNNNAPTILQNFTPYPTVQIAPQNYKSGALTGLIGSITTGADGQPMYTDSIALRDAIMALSVSQNPIFLRDRKGDLLRVKISGGISMDTADATKEQMQTAKIPWVEVGSAAGVSVFAAEG